MKEKKKKKKKKSETKEPKEDEKMVKKEKKRRKKEGPSPSGEELGISAILDAEATIAAQPPTTEVPSKINPEKASFFTFFAALWETIVTVRSVGTIDEKIQVKVKVQAAGTRHQRNSRCNCIGYTQIHRGRGGGGSTEWS